MNINFKRVYNYMTVNILDELLDFSHWGGRRDSALQDGNLDSALQDGNLDSALQDGNLDSPLQDGNLDSPLQDGGLVLSSVKNMVIFSILHQTCSILW